MKITAFMAFACAAGTLLAQPSPAAKQTEGPTTKEIREEFYAVTNSIRQAADEMPESDYAFKPVAGMRSFAELLNHVADVQMNSCHSILRDPKPIPAMTGRSKGEVKKSLAASFDECYEAFSNLSAQNENQLVPTPAGQRTKIAALTMVLSHNNEEYGYMAVYLRLKGVVPPTSRGAAEHEYKGK